MNKEGITSCVLMSLKQTNQFKLFGCVPRCVAELAARRGNTITWDEFCTRFDGCFSDPENRYGLLDISALPPILHALSLPERLTEETDYQKVKDAFNREKKLVLVLSTVDLNPGATGENNHCSVLNSISESQFQLWTPSQCGGNFVLPPFDVPDWKAKGCIAIILS
jgi:hypothetical protein